MTLIPLTTTTTTRTRDLSNLPDSANPNSHCHSCNFTCASRNNFASHLRRTHNMEIAPLPPKSNTNVVPDPFDPNFFCISSNRKYPTRWKYRHHLNSMHDMNLPPLAKCKKWNANFNCITCSQRFETGRLYLMHLSIIRNMVELSPNLEKNLIPTSYAVTFVSALMQAYLISNFTIEDFIQIIVALLFDRYKIR